MRRITYMILMLLLISTLAFAEDNLQTDLQSHQNGFKDTLKTGNAWYSDDDKPGAFNVTFEGVDEEANGPIFHITFTSNEFYGNYSGWTFKFDVTGYTNGAEGVSGFNIDNGSTVVSERNDENGNQWKTIQHDYYFVANNPENLPIDNTYTWGLTRQSQHGYIMFVFNEVEFDITYDPEAVSEDNTDANEYTIEDTSSDTSKKSSMSSIFKTITALGVGGAAAYIMMKRRRKIKLKRSKPIPQKKIPTPDKKSFLQKTVSFVKRTGDLAIKGLQTVSKGISNTYEGIKKIGINTKLGRLEIGDLTGFTGADKIMNINETINDLCDAINKKKNLNKVWKNIVNRYISKEMGKLKNIIGKGLKVNPKTSRKFINIEKEFNAFKGLVKEGVSVDEIFDINEKCAPYKNAPTYVEKINTRIEQTYRKVDKGITIEENNFKKVF